MSYGVGFALLCLLLTGCNDVLFKRYSIGGHSRGMFIFGVGLIWTLALVFNFNQHHSRHSRISHGFVMWLLSGALYK